MPESKPQPDRHYDLDAGLRLHVREWGDADGWPIVFLHGGAHDGARWEPVCTRLPTAWRCIAPDQRGHGASARAPDGDYSCDAQSRDLLALLDALAIARCALVGHSMGGLNALRLAGLQPERVAALVLIDVATETREAGLRALERSRQRRPARSARPLEDNENAPSFDLRLLDFVPTFGGSTDERRALLAAAACPWLLLRGANSRILSPEAAARSARLAAGRLVEIPAAGHDVAGHNPAAVATALTEFLGPLADPPTG